MAERAEALLALDEALDRLGEVDARLAQVVECRFFAGLTEAETADSPRRVAANGGPRVGRGEGMALPGAEG